MTQATAAALQQAGRKLVIRVVLIAIAISIFSIASFVLAQGTARLPQQLLRLTLTLVLCMFLLRGAPWARWVSAVLFLAGGLLSVGAGLTLLGTPSSAWVMVGMGAIYLYCAGVLMLERSVRAFFDAAGA